MPKTPVYDPGSVTLRALPNPQVTAGAEPASFGRAEAQQTGQIADALGQVADAAARFTLASQAKTDTALSRDSYNNASLEARVIDTDIKSREGADAVDVFDEARRRFDDIGKKHIGELKTDRQKELFTASYDALKVSYLNNIISFQEDQRSKFEIATLKAENLQASEYAADNRNDAEAIHIGEDIIVANTRFMNRGFPGPVKDKAVADAVDLHYKKVLEAITRDSPSAGLAFLKENEDKFNPITLPTIEGQLDKLAETEVIRNTALTISSSSLSLEDQLAEVDKIEDATVAKGVRSFIKEIDREKKLIGKANAQEAIDNEWDSMVSDPLSYVIPATLPLKTQKAMREYKNLRRNQWAQERGTGFTDVTDWPRFYELMSMRPEDIAVVDLEKEFGSLAESEFKQVLSHQRNSRFGSASSKGKDADRIRTLHQQVSDAILGMSFFDLTKASKKGLNATDDQIIKRKGRFFEQVSRRLAREEDRSEKRIGEIIDEELEPREITKWGKNIHTKKFEIPYLNEFEERAALQDIPERLKGIIDLKYDVDTDSYFVRDEVRILIYDREGNIVDGGERPAR